MIRLRWCRILPALFVLHAALAQAQTGSAVDRARGYYDGLFYDSAITTAQAGLTARSLALEDRKALYELLGYSYASIDSTSQAVEAFRELILLDPDREPDPLRVSPRITSRYQLALGQVLVVRRLAMDSTSFVAGEGAGLMRFVVSRAAGVHVRLIGGGRDVVLDSQAVAGAAAVEWNGLLDGAPAPAGRYDLIVEAVAGRDRDQRALSLAVSHSALDTLPHLTALPGYEEQPEFERPQRNWTPLGVAAVYVGAGVAATLALRNTSLGRGVDGGVVVVGSLALASGVAVSLRRPDPRPVPAGMLYNRLLRDLLARRNETIAQENGVRARKTVLTVVQLDRRGP